MEKRFEALDSWRGVCACMVAIFHFSQQINWDLRDNLVVTHSWLFVDFFFVLSGFVIATAYRARLERGEVVGFLIRRFGRLYPLHFATLVAAIALAVFRVLLPLSEFNPRAIFDGDLYDFTAIFTHLPLLHGIGFENHLSWNFPSWSISAEFWTYVVIALAWAALAKRAYIATFSFVVICPILLVIFPESTPSAMTLVRCVFCFSVGSIMQVIFRKADKIAALFAKPAVATAIELFAIAACGVYLIQPVADSLVAPLVFAMVVLTFSYEGGWLSRMLKLRPFIGLGTLSYSIYMMHIIVWQSVMLVMNGVQNAGIVDMKSLDPQTGKELWGPNALLGDVGMLLALGLVIVSSILTYRFIEQPGRRWGVRLAKRWEQGGWKGLLARSPAGAAQAGQTPQ